MSSIRDRKRAPSIETSQSTEEPYTPRRTSSRLQAKAKNSQESFREGSATRSTRRSRSRSAQRETQVEKPKEEKIVLQIISEDEDNRPPEHTTASAKSSKRAQRAKSRSTTPTRVLPPRAAAKSPSRDTAAFTPLRLTRSARKLGFGTPKDQEEESIKLRIAESPKSDSSVEILDSPGTTYPSLLRTEEEEPMDVGDAEFIEIVNPVLAHSKEDSTTKEHVCEGANNVPAIEKGEINFDVTVTERVDLTVERILKFSYSENLPMTEQNTVNASSSLEAVQGTENTERNENSTCKAEDGEEETVSLAQISVKPEESSLNESKVIIDVIGENGSDEHLAVQQGAVGDLSSLEVVQETERIEERRSSICKTHEGDEENIVSSVQKSVECKGSSLNESKVITDATEENSDDRLTNPSIVSPEISEVDTLRNSSVDKRKSKSPHNDIACQIIEDTAEHIMFLPINDKKKKKKKKSFVNSLNNSIGVLTADNEENVQSYSKSTIIPENWDEEDIENAMKKSGDVARKKKKSKRTMTSQINEDAEDQTEDNHSIEYPAINFKKMFSEPTSSSLKLLTLLQKVYSRSNKIQKRPDDLPDLFLNNNTETVWQFVAHKNRQINNDWKKHKALLDESIAISGFSSDEDNFVIKESLYEDEQLGSDDEEVVDEDDYDLFNLNDEDLKDLEKELRMEGEDIEKENEKPQKKNFSRSVVDDRFFNLAEMNAFCDEVEKEDDQQDFLSTVDDSWGGPVNYRYEDFFGKLDDVVGEEKSVQRITKRKASVASNMPPKKKKSVRFDLAEDNEIVDEVPEDDIPPGSSKVLHGGKDDVAEKESKLKLDIRKLKESIRKLEEENLAPRSWELGGEVSAQQRSENELLETHIQFDNTSKRAPEVTEEFTARIEAIIKQRIKDKAFDDVVRIKKIEGKSAIYRNEAIEEQEMMKKSLSEVYEKDYQKAAGQSEKTVSENPVHKAIEERMKNLFVLIDAMSHFEYTPPPIRPEIKVVSNMAALNKEEVGMQASTDAHLLAPEEVKKKLKGELKASEERTKTDKLRQRRKKKSKQRAMVLQVGAERALAKQIKGKMSKKKISGADTKGENLKSSTFFSKLQDTVQKEAKGKTTKKKVKSEKVTTSGSNFKL